MKKFVFILIFITVCSIAFANTIYIYDKSGNTVLYRIENNLIYEGRYSNNII
jgi:hypothetical protein